MLIIANQHECKNKLIIKSEIKFKRKCRMGKSVVISGANRGIGLAMTKLFLQKQ